jgi:hypothetical protein
MIFVDFWTKSGEAKTMVSHRTLRFYFGPVKSMMAQKQ